MHLQNDTQWNSNECGVSQLPIHKYIKSGYNNALGDGVMWIWGDKENASIECQWFY